MSNNGTHKIFKNIEVSEKVLFNLSERVDKLRTKYSLLECIDWESPAHDERRQMCLDDLTREISVELEGLHAEIEKIRGE